MRLLCSLLIALMFLFAENVKAQGKLADSLINTLQRDVWVHEKTCFHLSWGKDSCENYPVDSGGFFLFEASSRVPFDGMQFSRSLVRNGRGFIADPSTGERHMLYHSCPDIYCFLGSSGKYWHILIVGEHWPYYASVQMLSDSSFSVELLEGDRLQTDYYRRVPVPEFLKKRD